MKLDKSHCHGCRDDFYNGTGARECWLLEKATLVTRYRIHRDSPMTTPNVFKKVVVPNCKNGNGWYYLKELPEHLRKPRRSPSPDRP